MAKVQTTLQLPYETLRTLKLMSDNLMKSKNWIVEKSIYSFGGTMDKFLSIDEEFREFLRIKRDSWKDDIRNDMLKYHLRKGFLLKNSIRKIIEMIQSNVNTEHIEKAIIVYEHLCTDGEYLSILQDMKKGILNRNKFDVTMIQERIKGLGQNNRYREQGNKYRGHGT